MTPLEKFHIFAKEYYESFNCLGPEERGHRRFPDQEKFKAAWINVYPNINFYTLWDEYVESKIYRDYINDFKR